jgi:hypothetical protein
VKHRAGQLSLLQRTKAHYEQCRGDARLQGARAIQALGMNVRAMSCSRRAIEAIKEQWSPLRQPDTPSWDWEEIMRRYSDMKSLDLAVWTPDERLVLVAIATFSPAALTLRYVEADPSPECEFRGKRVLMALEIATRYAQMCGLDELRIHPVNDALVQLYETTYGFTLVKPKAEVPYWSRKI